MEINQMKEKCKGLFWFEHLFHIISNLSSKICIFCVFQKKNKKTKKIKNLFVFANCVLTATMYIIQLNLIII